MDDSTAQATSLESIALHQRKHHLRAMAVSLPSHGDTQVHVSLYPWDGSVLTELAVWLRSLNGVVASMTLYQATVHLKAIGAMTDGTPVQVVIVLDHGPEYDLLAANTEIAHNAAVSVELLLSLVSADAAETRVEPVLAGAS